MHSAFEKLILLFTVVVQYTSVLFVTATPGGTLAKELRKREEEVFAIQNGIRPADAQSKTKGEEDRSHGNGQPINL